MGFFLQNEEWMNSWHVELDQSLERQEDETDAEVRA